LRAPGHRWSWSWLLPVLTAGVLGSADGRAQDWLPPQGEAWFSFGYGNALASKHYLGVIDPGEIDAGHVRGQGIALQTGYGLTDSLALSLGIPFVDNIYYCTSATVACTPHPGSNADDFTYHGTLQDFRIALDYQLIKGEFSLAPFAAAVIPSHGYVYFAHAAPGKDLHQYLVGFTAAGGLERFLPATYFVATYDYAFVQPVLGININRSDFALELGYFLTFWTPALGVRFLGNGFYTHGGLAYNNPFELLSLPNGDVLFLHHDQIGKTRSVQLGGGLTYQLSGSTIVYASYLRSVYGRDILKLDQGVSFGVTWNFSPQQIIRSILSPKRPSSPPIGQ
jgi:hypothetical protein